LRPTQEALARRRSSFIDAVAVEIELLNSGTENVGHIHRIAVDPYISRNIELSWA
jgi:hypothetical protein